MHWQKILASNLTDTQPFAASLEPKIKKKILHNPKFPFFLPKRLADKIKFDDWNDPILLQFVPLLEETKKTQGFTKNPLEEQKYQTLNLLQKYKGRALLIVSNACACHCRFCFRKNSPLLSLKDDFEQELSLIENNSSLSELLLSGGDPLSLSNEKLSKLLQNLSSIPHIKRIRIHTRFPIAIPERIDEGLLQVLRQCTKQLYLVLHINHPLELDNEVLFSLSKIRNLGIPLLCQSVLLNKVNDNVLILKELYEMLIDNGIIPYYLHQLDKIEGASHFEVSKSKGKHLIKELQILLPGYAVPKYVREVAGKKSKCLL